MENFLLPESRNRFLTIQVDSDDDDKNDEEHYNKIKYYVIGLIGVTVGFGSFWRFPALIFQNGGGVFLIPYALAIIFIGIPLLYLETVTGQMTQSSLPMGFMKINKGLKYLGVAVLLSAFHGSGYYNIGLVYSMRYMISGFESPLPYAGESPIQNKYFLQQVLGKSNSIYQFGGIHLDLYSLFAISMIVLYFFIRKGVRNSEKLIVFTALSPFPLFILLLLNAFHLQNSRYGFYYLFTPKWQYLWRPGIWIDAVIQVVFQLNVGLGIIYNFSSMKKIQFKIGKPMYIILVSVVLCGFLCAMNIFMYLSHMCYAKNLRIEDLTVSGPQLSFNVFPKALTLLAFPNAWILIFFFTMVCMGFVTQFGSLEAISCFLKDELEKAKTVFGYQITFSKANKIMIVLILIVWAPFLTSSSGIYYIEYLDKFTFDLPIIINVIIQIYVFVYLMKFDELEKIINDKTQDPMPKWIKAILTSKIFFGVLILLFLLIFWETFTSFTEYDFGYYLLGWILAIYPYCIAYYYWTNYKQEKFVTSYNEILQISLNSPKSPHRKKLKEIQMQ